jgi:hypothetical protein
MERQKEAAKLIITTEGETRIILRPEYFIR